MEIDEKWKTDIDKRASEEAEKEMMSLVDPKTSQRFQDLKEQQIHLWEIKQMDLAFEHTSDSDKECQIIRNKLWIGDFESARKLPSPKITGVVSLGLRYSGYPTLENVKYYRIMIDDDNNCDIAKYFEVATEFIHNHNGGVLVHCQAGVSRSATICIAYLMKYLGLSFFSAYMAVKASRLVIAPNAGFVKQLLKFEDELIKKI